jgi:hypothetical protein
VEDSLNCGVTREDSHLIRKFRTFYKNKNWANPISPGMFFSVFAGKTGNFQKKMFILQSKCTLNNG